jgi:branched-chain amino acid aminotransferase
MSFICFNGDLIKKSAPFLHADNRGFKYGDGVFETILFLNRRIVLEDYHFERLFNSLQFLQIKFNHLSKENLIRYIHTVCEKNNYTSCRIRLSVYRNEDDSASYVIEAIETPDDIHEFNKEGWSIGLYPFARKSMDAFSNIKTLSYQQFIMADKYAKENFWNESIILNANSNICEGSKTNIFIYRKQEVFTPALHEGCVNGVMRRHVIDVIKKIGIPVQQVTVKEEDILDSDEVFVTNALQVVKWVKNFKEKKFSSSFSKELSHRIINNF